MTINTSTLGGGSSPLGLIGFDSGIISSGAAAGDLLTVTAGAAKQYIKVIHLVAGAALEQPNMTLTVDGNVVFSGVDLYRSNGTSSVAIASRTGFCVVNSVGATNNVGTARIQKYFICKSFTLALDSGSTTEGINYAYETLEEL